MNRSPSSSASEEYFDYASYDVKSDQQTEEHDERNDDYFDLSKVFSRTKQIYEDLVSKRRQIIEESSNDIYHQTGMLGENSAYTRVADIEEIAPSTLRCIRAKNKWLKTVKNLQANTEAIVLSSLKEGKKTFLTEASLPEIGHQSRAASFPKRRRAKHLFWSTQPSTESGIDAKFSEFNNATLNRLKSYSDISMDFSGGATTRRGRTKFQKNRPVRAKLAVATTLTRQHQMLLENAEPLNFNPLFYKQMATRAGGLSIELKEMLRSNPTLRTDQQLATIAEAIRRTKCFENLITSSQHQYHHVRLQLAKTIQLLTYGGNRTIIKQGHAAVSFYFILSGSVYVYRTVRDEATGHTKERMIQTLGQGNTFGEIALMVDNAKRTATIVTAGTCELLEVQKENFESILQEAQNTEWRERWEFLQRVPILKEMTDAELHNINHFCQLEYYDDSEVILGDTKKPQEYVTFIYRGECVVVKEIYLKKARELKLGTHTMTAVHKPPLTYELASKTEIQLHHASSGRRRAVPYNIVRKLLCVRRLRCTNSFGAGEDLTDTYIVTVGKVGCLKMPTEELLIKTSHRKMYGEMACLFELAIPSKQASYESYLREKNWTKYKEKLVEDAVQKWKDERERMCHNTQQLLIRKT